MVNIGSIVRTNRLACKISIPLYYIKQFFENRAYLDDENYLKYIFYKKMGKDLNLDSPRTFNEKLQWLKINDRSDCHTVYADKLKLKKIVRDLLGDEYTTKTYFETKKPSLISGYIPRNFPVVIKTNHDQGTVFVVNNPTKRELLIIENKLRIALAKNLYWRYREWQYKNIEKTIYIEEFIENDKKSLDELKIHIANGNCICIKHKRNFENNTYYNWYSRDWQPLKIKRPNQLEGDSIDRPKNLEKLIDVAKKISEGFLFARVDIMMNDDRIIVGEVTFHPAGGLRPFIPESDDLKLGSQLHLKHSDTRN